MGLGLKEIVLAGGLIFGGSKVMGQENIKMTSPWDYTPEFSIEYDFNKDGEKELIFAVDTAKLGSYGYKIFVASSDGQRKELDKTDGQIYGILAMDNKIVYFLNQSRPKENAKTKMDRNWLFERREIEYDSSGNFTEPKATGVSTENPYNSSIDFN
jgi:hypothetical protein